MGVCAAIMTTLAVVVVTACRCMRRKPGRPSFLLTRDVEKAQRTFYTRPTAKPISSPELSSPETGPSRHIPPTGKGSPHLTPTKWGSSGFPSPTQGEKRPPIGTFMGSTGRFIHLSPGISCAYPTGGGGVIFSEEQQQTNRNKVLLGTRF